MFKWFADLWQGEDRVLMTHGPVVRFIVVGQLISIGGLVTALVLTIALASSKVSGIESRADANAAGLVAVQASRKTAAFDSCKLLKGLVLSASVQAPTGRSLTQKQIRVRLRHRRERASRFLSANGIANCHEYSRNLTRLS